MLIVVQSFGETNHLATHAKVCCMPLSPTEHAQRIADAVATAWFSTARRSENIAVPLGAVATLSLIQPLDAPASSALTTRIRSISAQDLVRDMEKLWDSVWLLGSPYLVEASRSIHDWIRENPDSDTLAAVRQVQLAALAHEIHTLTGDLDPAHRSEADLLGSVLTTLRSGGARDGLGEFHTPPDAVGLMNQLTFSPSAERIERGARFLDPAAGSGGLARGAAQTIRRRQGDPAEHRWVLGDVDPLAAAACAVNALIWGLGPDVLVYCDDSLAEADAIEHEHSRRAEILAHHATTVSAAKTIAATREAMKLLAGETISTYDGRNAA